MPRSQERSGSIEHFLSHHYYCASLSSMRHEMIVVGVLCRGWRGEWEWWESRCWVLLPRTKNYY
jgi:hypothetical protein